MKILILANSDVGLWKLRKELISRLLTLGHEVFISVPSGDMTKRLEEMGCVHIQTKLNRRGKNPFSDLLLMLNYLKIIITIKPDLVITYTIKANIFGALVSRIARIPCIMNITGIGSGFQKNDVIKLLLINLYKVACKRVRTVFFENEDNRLNFVNMRIVCSEKTKLLTGAGVNLKEYSFTKYPIPENTLNFIFAGRVMKEKGIDEFLEVATKITGIYPNVRFDIVGYLEEEYTKILESLTTQSIVKFHEFQDDIRPFIAESCCCVLPSYHEGMSNILLESGAMGRPIITSDIPGCREAVIDGVSGYLVKVKDANDLYDKITKFISLTYAEKSAMGLESRKHMEMHFDRDIVVNESLMYILGIMI